ncbi:ATP-dependent DNA helicase, partial [Acetobacter senegalensis]
ITLHQNLLNSYAEKILIQKSLFLWGDYRLKAQTVASFLKARDKKIDGNTLVIVDESGVIPARQMQRLMEEIEKHGARAVFLGDTQQTKAIEAGKPYDQLISAGMSVSYVTEIQRQKANPELLKAVQFAAEGDTSKSLESFDQMKAVREIGEPSDRHKQIAEDFAKLDAGERRETIIVTGTNASRKEINTLVRRELGLEGQGTHFDLLNRLDTTQAERRFSRYYAVGAVVVPEQDFRQFGLERGKQYEVIDTGPGNLLTIKGEDGTTHSFDPSKAQLSVYGIERSELATGDSVKITRNDKGADLANGDRFTVLFHDKETNTLKLEANDGSGRQITLSAHDRMFVALDYASTVHSAQGKTCQKALLNLDSKSKTTVKEVYYVGVSRAKLQTTIYTDNLKNLPSAIQRDTYKTAALELTPEKKENKSWLDKLRTLVSKNHNSEKNKEGYDKTKTNEKEKEKDGMSR